MEKPYTSVCLILSKNAEKGREKNNSFVKKSGVRVSSLVQRFRAKRRVFEKLEIKDSRRRKF